MGKTVLLDGMNGIEGAGFYDSLFNNAFFDDAKKLGLVTRMRDFAIQYLQPVMPIIPRVMSSSLKAEYKAKGISLEWDLTAQHHAHEFCSTASNNESLSLSQKAAVDLLSHCTQAIEEGAISDLLWRWIRNDYMNLGLDVIATGEKFTSGRQPNTGGAIRKAIAKALSNSPGLKNPSLWETISKKPPRGWKFYNNGLGKYIEGPRAKNGTLQNMGYRRFCTVCGEEREKLKS